MTGLNALSIYLIKPTHNDFNLKWAFLKLCNPIKGLNIHTKVEIDKHLDKPNPLTSLIITGTCC